MRADQEQHGGSTPYRTSTRGMAPPLVTTDFLVQDDGKGSLVIQTHMCGTLTY